MPPGTTEEAADRMQRLLDISQQEQEAIRELTPPDELEEPLEAYLEAREEAFQHLRDAETSIRDGDERGYAKADQELEEGEGERARLAAAVGFEVCSRRERGLAPEQPAALRAAAGEPAETERHREVPEARKPETAARARSGEPWGGGPDDVGRDLGPAQPRQRPPVLRLVAAPRRPRAPRRR